jgi:hypothetical protein
MYHPFYSFIEFCRDSYIRALEDARQGKLAVALGLQDYNSGFLLHHWVQDINIPAPDT